MITANIRSQCKLYIFINSDSGYRGFLTKQAFFINKQRIMNKLFNGIIDIITVIFIIFNSYSFSKILSKIIPCREIFLNLSSRTLHLIKMWYRVHDMEDYFFYSWNAVERVISSTMPYNHDLKINERVHTDPQHHLQTKIAVITFINKLFLC